MIALASGLAFAPAVLAHDGKDHIKKDAAAGQLVEPAGTDAAWLAKARESYPLKTCLVSDEEFGGSMGKAIERIYREKGKPDRLIRFCCKSCLNDFNKNPSEYLRKLDAVAKPSPSKHHH